MGYEERVEGPRLAARARLRSGAAPHTGSERERGNSDETQHPSHRAGDNAGCSSLYSRLGLPAPRRQSSPPTSQACSEIVVVPTPARLRGPRPEPCGAGRATHAMVFTKGPARRLHRTARVDSATRVQDPNSATGTRAASPQAPPHPLPLQPRHIPKSGSVTSPKSGSVTSPRRVPSHPSPPAPFGFLCSPCRPCATRTRPPPTRRLTCPSQPASRVGYPRRAPPCPAARAQATPDRPR